MTLIGRIMMVALALGAFATFSSTSAFAACTDADPNLCSVDECRSRQAIVHPTCDQPRSCNANNLTQAELKSRLAINQACLAARQNVQACFSGSDAGHNAAITAVQNAIATCQSKITG